MAYAVTVAGADITCLIDSLDISHGRDNTTDQPEASACTLELSRDAAGDFGLPPGLEIGASLTVDADGHRRFTGRVTDVALAWEESGSQTPDAGIGQVVATGLLDDLARRLVGAADWPQELDGARVARIMTEAQVPYDPAYMDPGTVQILARVAETVTGLDLARDVADSGGGLVWETLAGAVRYADADHRRGVVSSLTLDSCDILVTPTWKRTLDGLINQASVSWGADSSAIPATSINQHSRDVFGPYGISVTTLLARQADAQAMAQLLTTRGGEPVWIFTALPVDLTALSAGDLAALWALEVHSLITVTGLPAIGTAPTSAVLWVEGWHETISATERELELVVSGFCRTTPPPRWDDVAPTWTWDTMPASMTWDGMTCWGPPANLGRWDDTPASLRWDQVPASVTWDTWDAYARG